MKAFSVMPTEAGIDLILISEDFRNHDYWSRIDILSEAIYDVFVPIEVVGFTPEEWDNQTSPLYDYAKQGEILYAARPCQCYDAFPYFSLRKFINEPV